MPGLWLFEGKIHCGSYWTDYGYEYDYDLDGDVRKLTAEEWEMYDETGVPWDVSDWGEPWASPPDDLPHTYVETSQRCTGCGHWRTV